MQIKKRQKQGSSLRRNVFCCLILALLAFTWIAYEPIVSSIFGHDDHKVAAMVPFASVANDKIRQRTTETGVDVSDRVLYETWDMNGDSSSATVMAMAQGQRLENFKIFVGSLRHAGYSGHIIMGVSPDVTPEVLDYLHSRKVTPKTLEYVPCEYTMLPGETEDIFKDKQCVSPYTKIKIEWSRYALQRDWLLECKTCTGPVLSMDTIDDAFFQLDPFGPGSPPITGLQVFQEHPNKTTSFWQSDFPVGRCKGIRLNEAMLCSESTIGTRPAMLTYYEAMYAEMMVWIERAECRFPMHLDDLSIHNYLYYSGQLPFAVSIPHRSGIVNVVGFEGEHVFGKWHKEGNENAVKPFPGAKGGSWIGTDYGLTDGEGFFTNYDGSRSRVIEQADRFGYYYWHMYVPNQTWANY